MVRVGLLFLPSDESNVCISINASGSLLALSKILLTKYHLFICSLVYFVEIRE